jgi:type VI secretion system secreted protein Hcp
MKLAIILVVTLGLVMASSSAFAETNAPRNSGDPIYMNFAGISGNSNGPTGPCNGIQLDSFQWGVGTETTVGSATGGAGSGKIKFNDITVTKRMDKTSPLLLQQEFTGKSGAVSIDFCRKAGGQPYAEYKLDNGLISSYSVSSGGDMPTESISINFTKVTFSFFYTAPDGSLATSTVSFDILANSLS